MSNWDFLHWWIVRDEIQTKDFLFWQKKLKSNQAMFGSWEWEQNILHDGRLFIYSLSPVIVICCWMKEWLWGSKPTPRRSRHHWQIPGTGSISRWMEMEIMIASASSIHPPLASQHVRTVEISSWDIPEHVISQILKPTERRIIDQDYFLYENTQSHIIKNLS